MTQIASRLNLLIIHHDADLYGADQSLLRSVQALTRQDYHPIVVVPHQGPLIERLQATGAEVHIGPVGKLTRQLMRPSALPMLLGDLFRSFRCMQRAAAGRSIALVYTNSVAAIGGAIWAAWHRRPRLWHVREIVIAPKAAARGFPALLRWLGGWCICNSGATRSWITSQEPALAARSSVIWNGLEPVTAPSAEAVQAFRDKLGLASDDVVATLVGRINRWKGQRVFIEAARLLQANGPAKLKFLIVGDVADGQVHFREEMLAAIDQAGLRDKVFWHPFTPDVDTVWAASQIAVAPSIEPEPFGRVAIEAMAHSLPVVATAFGGLAEIVEDRRTGLLVKAGDADALAAAIGELAASEQMRTALGEAGRRRQAEFFTQAAHDQQLLATIERLMAKAAQV